MMKPKSGNDRGKVEDGRLMHNRRSADVGPVWDPVEKTAYQAGKKQLLLVGCF